MGTGDRAANLPGVTAPAADEILARIAGASEDALRAGFEHHIEFDLARASYELRRIKSRLDQIEDALKQGTRLT